MKGFFPGLVLVAAFPSIVWGQAPAGAEFQINSYTTNTQRFGAVASDANGDFVVVWGGDGQDGSSYGVFGQRFNASGVTQGAEFQVNTYTTGFQTSAAVSSDANGNFVVVWTSLPDGGGYGIFGRRYNATGIPQGAEFQVNSYTTSGQYLPTVAFDANGNFVVAWRSSGQDGSSYGIFGKRFNAAGAALGGDFQVNAYTTGGQTAPRIASDANGNFVVVWTSYGQDGSRY